MVNSTLDFLEKGKILEIPNDTKYWLVRADGGKYYNDFLLNNFIAISDDEITLDAISKFPQFNTGVGRTIEGYKNLYQEKYGDWNNQQIAHAASRTFKFIDEINENDIVVVPSQRSTTFIVGIVVGETYESTGTESKVPIHYHSCPYLKRRKVHWIKEVPRVAISEKMYWILSSHQSVLSLDEHAEYIDKLLAPIYIKNGYCYGVLNVNKKKGVTSSEWLKLYNIIEDVKDDSSKIIVKSNVQSPGYIEILSELANLPKIVSIILLLSGGLFGKIKIGGVEVQGVIPYFFGNGKLERERMRLENENMKLDNDLKRIDVENKKRENDLIIDLSQIEEKAEKEKAETTARELSQELKISAFSAGTTLGHKTRIDNEDSQDVAGRE
ncbi:hypothetical protein QT711_11155 [Sporosarcina saromensis]|uniref:GAF domain-containing protein n=1 Tax=Sporosarcina saromensis TaxID=359365 RepID=A0ABU4G9W0_9BACL|nr:hypothetical protein [Sporosarcina saromensis]MDW0113745.1 hypothetical protein [Sporosarcina saromensis]